MTTLTVRRARPADSERIRELNELAMAETPEWVPEAPDADLADVQTHYHDAGGEFLVGVRDNHEGARDERIVATAAYEPLAGWMREQFATGRLPGGSADRPESTVELSRMRVDPDCWGQGYGTRMYEALASRARSAGYHAFVLNTGVDNDRAREFYESLGFDAVREVTVEFDDVTLALALYRREID
jgi:ribosomal protein S18 acetylase RimI-like enzyme